MSMKNPLTPAGIEPATFRFVAQHLNHYATAVPNMIYRGGYMYIRCIYITINVLMSSNWSCIATSDSIITE